MPRAPDGTYTPPVDSFNPAIAGTPIDPVDWNATQDDYADALTDSFSRTGDGGMLADLELDAHAILASEISTPANPAADKLKIYAKDVGGTTRLTVLDSAGTELSLTPSGGGSVTSFSAGNLSPLFTTNVATATTTPALTFSLTAAGATTYLGSIAGGAPSYVTGGSLTKADDTNVTMTLGGTPANALLSTGVSMTLGWTGTLSGARGGTGTGTYAVGDILYASTTSALSRLADVAAGSYLRSGGVTTAPLWSTTTLPNSATQGDLMYASASNVYSNLAAVASGNVLTSAGTGTAPSYSSAPTISTSVTTPLLIGGTGVGSDLTFQTTTGVGDGTDIFIFKRGNNGATTAANIRPVGMEVGGGAASPYAWAQTGTTQGYVQVGVNGAFVGDSSGTANAGCGIICNAYFDGTNYRYMVSSGAALNAFGSGVFAVQTAPSGTAGNIVTLTEHLRVTNAGQFNVTPGGNNSMVFPVTASAVNYYQVDHKATTVSPTISAVGTATNLDFQTVAKGTGVLINLGSYTNTAALSGAMTINSSGLIQRQTSSIDFKRDVENIDPSYAELFIEGLRPVFYRDRSDKITVEEGREDWSYYGLIAEEVANLDPRYASWGPKQTGKFDGNGQHIMTDEIFPVGVHYDRIVVAAICYMRNKISNLENQLNSMKGN